MIFITGVSGFIGSHLLLSLDEYDVRVLLRNECKLDTIRDVDIRLGSLGDNLSEHLEGIECVVHCAGLSSTNQVSADKILKVNYEDTMKLARDCLNNNVKRFIFISSIKVCGELSTRRLFDNNSDYLPSDAYSISKAKAEKDLIELSKNSDLEVVIIRPALVYGPGVKANFASLMTLVSKWIPLPFGCITNNKRSLVSVENLVDLIITCIEHPNAANQVFLVSDDYDISTSEMVRELALAMGKPNWQLPIPIWCYKLFGTFFNKSDVIDRLVGSLQADITHTKETLGWRPPQTLQCGFKRTAEAFLQSKKNSGES
ncbi:NAD-dependent epimerase/dehydratase family protein [Vibrio furnissii]|uniref:NAD-dependent epimerase/dehydratase family protein n=1 Tax=Vibrio furnissii TaxID=29494 RepID=UPI0037526EF3